MSERKIVWRKWQDPMLPLVSKNKLAETHYEEEDDDDPEFQAYKDEFGCREDVETIDNNRILKHALGPAIISNNGIVPFLESNIPSALFNFWSLDANFTLSKDVVEAICAVPGVETVDVFTRYRLRLAIGRSFKEKDVKLAIEQAVCKPEPAKDEKQAGRADDKMANMKTMLAKKFAHWAIFVMPNGRLEFAGGKTVDEVKTKSEQYATATSVVVSWEGQ